MSAEPSVRGARILVVDDDEIILIALAETLKHEGYEVTTTQSPRQAIEFLRTQRFAVIISDQRMAEMTGLEFLQQAAKLQSAASRILITGVLTLKTIIAAINTGEIYRFIAKPWLREELLATIRNAVQRHQLVEVNRKLQEDTLRLNEQLAGANSELQGKIGELTRRQKELEAAHEALHQNFQHSLELVHRIIAAFHPVLGQEIRQVAEICERMVEAGQLDEQEQHILRASAWLHNVGLIGVSRELLAKARSKPGELTESELAMFHHHPIYGQMLAGFIDTLEEVGATIRASHERWDGSGYPDGLEGENIPRTARLLSVAVHFAESQLPREEAIDEILRLSGSAFEPEAVRLFLKATRLVALPRKVREVLFSELRPGMVLARGIYSPSGLLLIPDGHVLSDQSLAKIRRHNLATPISQRLLVYG